MTSPSDAPRPPAPSGTDVVLRAMTNDHAFRVVAADTSQTARDVAAAQGVSGPTAHRLAELVTASILVRETMAPTYRVQGLLKGASGMGRMLGDSFPDGGTRGLVQVADGHELSLGDGALLQMMRSLPNGALSQGIVEVGGADGIANAVMKYFQESEQVVSVVALGAQAGPDGLIRTAGGYVIQLLPEPERALHAVMTARLEDFPTIEAFLERDDFGAKLLLDEILFGMPLTMLGESPVGFVCRCSEAALLGAIATLGRAEIESLVAEEESLEIRCDYCHKNYLIAPERLRSLLEAS